MMSVNRKAAGLLLASGLGIAIAFPAMGQVQAPGYARPADFSGQPEQLAELAQTQSPMTFRQALDEVLSPLNDSQRSQLLKLLLLSLRDNQPSPAGHWLIDHVTKADTLDPKPHPERAAYAHDPIGLSAVAQGTRNAWSWKQWQERVIHSAQHGQWQVISDLVAISNSSRPEDKAALRGAVAGIAAVDVLTLNHPALVDRLIDEDVLKPLTLAVVRRTGNTELLAKAMAHWPKTEQHSVTLTLDRWVGMSTALSTWRVLLQQTSPQSAPARDALKRALRSGKLSTAQRRQATAALEVTP
ncbi:MAG: hypothetical protein AB8B96_17780 [Lysobacterales bacterium]